MSTLNTVTTSNFHGEVWNLDTVLGNNSYSLSTTDTPPTPTTYCYQESSAQSCVKNDQWANTLVARSKTLSGGPDLCVCLSKESEQDEDTVGSKYCPEMFVPGEWEIDREIKTPGRFNYSWCTQNDGELCEDQDIPSVRPDRVITTKEQCADYMRKNYPETVYTTFHTLENGVQECKGYVHSDNPEEINAQPGTGWSTLSSYKKKGGKATNIHVLDWNPTGKGNANTGKTYIGDDSCSKNLKQVQKGQSDKNFQLWISNGEPNIAGSPADCPAFRSTTDTLELPAQFMFETTCEYPENAIPTQEGAEALIDNPDIENAGQFLANYCFQPETEHLSTSQYDSAPKALTFLDAKDREICRKFREKFPEFHDAAGIEYCTGIYERHKDDKAFNFLNTGCQCLIDTGQASGEASPILETLTSTLEVPPSCVWDPCIDPTQQVVPVINNTALDCPETLCSNFIVFLGDNEVENIHFEQNIKCDRTGSECEKDSDCVTGKCNNLGTCGDVEKPSNGKPSNGKPSNGKPSDNNIIIGIIVVIVASLLVIGLALWWLWK